MKWLFLALVYAAFGLAFMVVFGEPLTIRVYDASFWAWVLGWPVIIGMKILWWVLIAAAVIAAIVGVIIWRESR